MNRLLALLCRVVVVLVATMPLSAAEMYRWVDKDGNVHFSDKPPEGVKEAKKMTLKEAPLLSGDESDDSTDRVQRAVTAMQGDRRAREAHRAEEEKNRAERAKRCAEAQKEWNDYTRSNIRVMRDENNELRGMTEAEMRRTEEQLKERVQAYCS